MSKQPSAETPDAIFEQIGQFSRQFRKQIAKGETPKIERFLGKVAESGKENLFSSLLDVEISFRRSQSESPTSAEYLKRFPQYTRLVRRAFFEPTVDPGSASEDGGATVSTDDHDDDQAFAPTFEIPAKRLGDYELLGQLGQGGMGVVYDARHTKTGNRVALKTLRTHVDGQQVDANKLYRFRKEFRSLSEVNHPNLVGMQTLEVDDNQWFFTMDLIEGEDFISYVRPNNQLDEARLRTCLPQLAKGIIALHQRGIVHRDLKPGNVMVNDQGHVLILDFGLVAKLQQNVDATQTHTGMFVGTIPYAAPEQMFGQRTEANDWYGFGTMVYEALVGKVPFPGNNQANLLRKQQEDPPSLTEDDEVPSDLAELADGLLRREAGPRLGADAVAEFLKLDDDTRIQSSVQGSTLGSMGSQGSKGSQGSSGSVDEENVDFDAFPEEEIVLIGREKQLAQLVEIKQKFLKCKEPSVVWVTGLSGEGKSSLVEKFLQPIRKSKEMLVLSGRCYDRESVPFKAVDAVIEALVRYLRSCPDATVSRLISDDVSVLTQLFPALQRVPEITRRVTASKVRFDERQVRHRAFFALRAILKQIGQKTPVVIFLDDLQWGDADSAEALFDILAPPESPSIMLVGTYRSDEVADSTFVQDWRELGERRGKVGTETTVEVEPLSREELGELMAGHFDVESASAMKQLDATYEETKGNPYFVSQLVERFDSQTSQIERLGLVSFTRMVQDKLSLLPAISGDILRVIAIAGQSLPVDDIARVLTTKSPVLSALAHMRSERLVRLIGSNDYQQIDTYHDKIREIVLEGLSESQRQDLHSRFGEMLESEIPSFDSLLEYLERDAARTEDAPESPERLYDLAYHFNASKNERSFTYQLMAGEQAYRAFSGDDAVAFLQRANATLPGNASVAIRYRLWERLATSLARCRKFEDSLEYFDRALRVAPSGLARATVFSGIAAVYQSLGNYSEATNNYDQAIEELGAPRPPKATQAIRLTLMIGRVFATPWRRPASGKRLCSQEHKLELDVYSNLVPYLFEHAESVFEYPFASFRLGKLSMKSGDSGRAAFGLGLFAAQVACNGAGRRGAKILEIAKRIDDQSMDLASRAMYKFSAAVVNQNTCQLQQSDQEFEASIPQLASTGHHMHASVGAHLHRHLLQVIGSSNREIEAANRVVRLGEETGDLRGQCWGHYDLASGLARRGELRESFQQIEEARQFLDAGQMNLTETIFLSTHGYCLLQASEYAAARPILEQSYRLLKARKIIMEYTSRCVPLLIESICGSNWLSGGTQKDHRYLKHLCRVAWLIDRVYPNIQSPVRRLRGRAFCLMGKKRRAIRCLESAVASAKSLGADHDQARSLLDLAAFQQLECDHLRTHAITLLKKTESVIPRAESWLLGDQYDEAVVAPEFDLETWEREHGPIDRTEQT